MYERLSRTTPVIGVAKTRFAGAEDDAPVYRGKSERPLYVTSVGIDLGEAARIVKNMGGSHRIPDVLKRADRLTRLRACDRSHSEW